MPSSVIPFTGRVTLFPGIFTSHYEFNNILFYPLKVHKQDAEGPVYVINKENDYGDLWAVYLTRQLGDLDTGDLDVIAYCDSKATAEALHMLLSKIATLARFGDTYLMKKIFDSQYNAFINEVPAPIQDGLFQSRITLHNYRNDQNNDYDTVEVEAMRLLINKDDLEGKGFGIGNPVFLHQAETCKEADSPDFWSVFLHIINPARIVDQIDVADCDSKFTAYTLYWVLISINSCFIRR